MIEQALERLEVVSFEFPQGIAGKIRIELPAAAPA